MGMKVKGAFIAARPRQINFKQGRRAGQTSESFQVAFVPASDEYGFPAVVTVELGVYGAAQNLKRDDQIELEYLETPTGERIAYNITELAS